MATTAISQAEHDKHGCPFCNYAKVFQRMSSNSAILAVCPRCDKGFHIVADDLTNSTWNEQPPVVPHPRPSQRWV